MQAALRDIGQCAKSHSEAMEVIGWAAISAHLGVHERTARRWNKAHPLPLFYYGGSIRAWAHKLDQWKHNFTIIVGE